MSEAISVLILSLLVGLQGYYVISNIVDHHVSIVTAFSLGAGLFAFVIMVHIAKKL